MREVSHQPLAFAAVKTVHPYAWLWEPVEHEPSFVLRSMFGAKALYLHGLMMLCFSAGEEPWRGLLVCTDRSRHAPLLADFPSLRPHRILPKWLYLPESANDFERCASQIVRLALTHDPRIGVVPGTRKRKRVRVDRLDTSRGPQSGQSSKSKAARGHRKKPMPTSRRSANASIQRRTPNAHG